MNIGEIVEILAPQLGISRTSYDIMANDAEMNQLRQVMNEAGLDLVNRASWRLLVGSFFFTAGKDWAAIPSDARASNPIIAIVNGGFFVPNRRIAAMELATSEGSMAWRYDGGKIQLSAPAQAGMKVYYIKKNWLNGTNNQIESSADVPWVPEAPFLDSVRVRWLRAQGIPADSEAQEFAANLEKAISQEAIAGGRLV